MQRTLKGQRWAGRSGSDSEAWDTGTFILACRRFSAASPGDHRSAWGQDPGESLLSGTVSHEDFRLLGNRHKTLSFPRYPFLPGSKSLEPLRDDLLNLSSWASLVAQWLRICLPMQGTRVRALVWEDPTCRGADRPVSHNY